ncbi:hypothetical protein [Castellaniella sp.]|uniref:hypothetical protein n=1 Tax=Castellaniella sp. TaxID=1955812 RepID=UPI002AFECBFA|nr:hypothetical protein [Castellaniella sp.]
MAITRTDPLADTLLNSSQGRVFNDRENFWVWLKTRYKIEEACHDAQRAQPNPQKHRKGIELLDELEETVFRSNNFGPPFPAFALAAIIRDRGLARELNIPFRTSFLPQQNFGWIGSQRCAIWLCTQFLNNNPDLKPISKLLPHGIPATKAFMGLVDFWDTTQTTKHRTLIGLEKSWRSYLKQDADYRWFDKGQEKRLKCEVAYLWLNDHHRRLVEPLQAKFSSLEDVQICLDNFSGTTGEKTAIIQAIKKAFNAHKAKKNREGKEQTNLALDKATKRSLDRLAQKSKLTRTQVVERLIQYARKNGMPTQEHEEQQPPLPVSDRPKQQAAAF